MTNPQKTFYYHFEAALQALAGCPLGFVSAQTVKGAEALRRARLEVAASMLRAGVSVTEIQKEANSTMIITQARKLLGKTLVPLSVPKGPSKHKYSYAFLNDLHKPGDSVIVDNLNFNYLGGIRRSASSKGMTVSISNKDVGTNQVKVTCIRHVEYENTERRFAHYHAIGLTTTNE